MNTLLQIKDKLRELYADYDIVIRPVLKFGLAVLTFLIINNELGYLATLNNLFILLILAVICSILPLNGMVLIGTLLIIGHCFGVGMEVGAFAAILYLLMLLLYFRFVPKDALVMLITPAAFICHVPAAVPLSLGQIRGPVSAFSVAFGVVSWQFIQAVHNTIQPMTAMEDASLLDVLQAMPQALLAQDTVFQIIVFVIVLLIVTAVRRLGGDYAYEKAIIAGAAVYVILSIAGSRILSLSVNVPELLFGTALSVLIAWVLKVFYYSADYTASEQLAFEDDRYYYQVKVIPKLHPVDSRTGEELPKENDSEVPEADTRQFRQIREEDADDRFKHVNLETELEQSLKGLGGTTSFASADTEKEKKEE